MATTQLARPYAAAAFERASATDQRERWSEMLALLAGIVADDRVARVLRSPRHSRSERAEVVLGIAGDHIDGEAANLVRVMAQNGRLIALADVAERYEVLRRMAEKRVEASVTSAVELDARERERISDKLRQRLGCEIGLQCRVDPALIGGAVIRAGDLVIDGSLKGRLDRLASHLAH